MTVYMQGATVLRVRWDQKSQTRQQWRGPRRNQGAEAKAPAMAFHDASEAGARRLAMGSTSGARRGAQVEGAGSPR